MFENNNYRRRKRRPRVVPPHQTAAIDQSEHAKSPAEEAETDGKKTSEDPDEGEEEVEITDQTTEEAGKGKKLALHYSEYVHFNDRGKDEYAGRLDTVSALTMGDCEVSGEEEEDMELAAATRVMAAKTMARLDAELGFKASRPDSTPQPDRVAFRTSSCSTDHPLPLFHSRFPDAQSGDDASKEPGEVEGKPRPRSDSASSNGSDRGGRGSDCSDASSRAASPAAAAAAPTPKTYSSFSIETLIGSSSAKAASKEVKDTSRPLPSRSSPDVFEKLNLPTPPPKICDMKTMDVSRMALLHARMAATHPAQLSSLATAWYGGMTPGGHLAHLMYGDHRPGAAFPVAYPHPLGLGHAALHPLAYPALELDSGRGPASAALPLAPSSQVTIANVLQKLT